MWPNEIGQRDLRHGPIGTSGVSFDVRRSRSVLTPRTFVAVVRVPSPCFHWRSTGRERR